MRWRWMAALAGLAVAGAVGLCLPLPGAPPVPEALQAPARGIADPQEALTFVSVAGAGGAAEPRLVTGETPEGPRALALAALADPPPADAFDAVARIGRARLAALAAAGGGEVVPWAALLPSGAEGISVAAGANFPEHAAEVATEPVFLFPKHAAPGGALSVVAARPGALLDYEAEICLRFDRDLRRVEDFAAAEKALFLCGDLTDRAVLLAAVDPGDPASGAGFADAKSGPGMFPTGPYLVLPVDWRAFLARERIATRVDGALRQSDTGGAMRQDFAELVARALAEGGEARWSLGGRPVALLDGGAIPAGRAILSGTPEGVIFRPPDAREIGCGAAAWLCLGGWMRTDVQGWVVARYARRLAAAGHFLQPGQVLEHEAAHLGRIEVRIVAP